MEKKTSFSLVNDCQRNADGSVDLEATTVKFVTLLQQYTANDIDNETIDAALHATFDKHPGAVMNKPYVVGQVMNIELDVDPTSFDFVKERVESYLTANASAKREDGKPFGVLRGRAKSGSCVRWADVPVEEKKS